MKQIQLKNLSQAGVYHLPPALQAEAQNQAQAAHFTQATAHLEACISVDAALRELGHAWGFPIWYGANFDALHDCLSDPDWPTTKGALLAIHGLTAWRNRDPEAFSTLIDVLRSALATRRSPAAPVWIVLDAPARGIPVFPAA